MFNKLMTNKLFMLTAMAVAVLLCQLVVTSSTAANNPYTSNPYQISGHQVMKQTTILGSMSMLNDTATVEPTAPFEGGRERLAARTVMTPQQSGSIPVDVINYASAISERSGSDRMVVDCTLSKAEDQMTLDRLADRVWRDNGGMNYRTVTINWHVGSNPEPANPWAQTVITRM